MPYKDEVQEVTKQKTSVTINEFYMTVYEIEWVFPSSEYSGNNDDDDDDMDLKERIPRN